MAIVGIPSFRFTVDCRRGQCAILFFHGVCVCVQSQNRADLFQSVSPTQTDLRSQPWTKRHPPTYWTQPVLTERLVPPSPTAQDGGPALDLGSGEVKLWALGGSSRFDRTGVNNRTRRSCLVSKQGGVPACNVTIS